MLLVLYLCGRLSRDTNVLRAMNVIWSGGVTYWLVKKFE